jgi:type I site-specific restriction-modification system R (restriction) subunit
MALFIGFTGTPIESVKGSVPRFEQSSLLP